MPLRIINPGEMTERRSVRRRRRLTEEEKVKAIKWRRDDMTYEKIGVLLGGVPPSTLERYLRGVKPENRIKTLETPPPQERPTPATERPASSWLDLYLLVTRLNRGDFDSPEAFIKEVDGLIGPVTEVNREACTYMWNEAMRTNKEAGERHEWEQEQMKKLFADLADPGKRGAIRLLRR